MEIHERFMNLSTTGAVILEILTDDPGRESVIAQLMETCDEKIQNGSADLKILQIFRTILCYEYQLLVKSREEDRPLESKGSTYIDIRTYFAGPENNDSSPEGLSLLYDIVVLLLTLYSNQRQIARSFTDCHESENGILRLDNKDKNLSLRVYECLADICNLCSYLYERKIQENIFEELNHAALTAIVSWLKQEDNEEWRTLASLLPKLAVTFGSKNIVTLLWNEILDDTNDLSKCLATLCVTADIAFPTEKTNVCSVHYKQCIRPEFWAILLRGLISTIYQQRKQALYLMKRAINFIESYKSEIIRELQSSMTNIVPFVSAEVSMDLEKKNFFLILEGLEEKQKHFVLPALTHLPSLVKAYTTQKTFQKSFNVLWLRCILKRILQHDSNTVMIVGLRQTLNADLDIYNQEFVDFLVNILNNTFLYEFDKSKQFHPEIVIELKNFFVRSEKAETCLIRMFVRSISKVSWGPVAIYWILNALLLVTKEQNIVHNTWTSEELNCMKSLIEKNLTMHSIPLRHGSKQIFLNLFCEYTRPHPGWSDVDLIVNTLTCGKDILFLFTTCISDLLSKIIDPIDAQSYIVRKSEELYADERQPESYASGIVLLLQSKLIFLTKDCFAARAFHQLLENLTDADERPYANVALILKLIEIIGHIMSLSFPSNEQCMKRIFQYIFPHIGTILKFFCQSLEKTSVTTFDEYILVTECFINGILSIGLHQIEANDNEVSNIKEQELKRLRDRCIRIITFPQEFSRNQWSYAVKVLYLCIESCWDSSGLDGAYILPLLRHYRNHIVDGFGSYSTELNGKSKGRFNSDYSKNVINLVDQIISKLECESWPPNVRWIEELSFILEAGSEHVIKSIAKILSILLRKCQPIVLQDLDIVISIVHRSWTYTFQLKKTEIFTEAVERLTELIVNSRFLILDGAPELATEYLNHFMKEGATSPLLKIKFIDCVKSLDSAHWVYVTKAVTSCLLHGAAPRRDQRIEKATVQRAVYPRWAASAVNLITVLVECKGSESEFRGMILDELLAVLEENRDKRYFDNSQLHRLKQRVMQTLLIMEPYLSKTETENLHHAICNYLIRESNQPSVRLMQEWLLIRIYAKDSLLRSSAWTLFEKANDTRPGSIVSIAGVIFHVSRLLEGKAKIEFISKGIIYLLPNCMSQQFNVRLYSQTVITKIYQMLPTDSPETQMYREIYEGVKDSLSHGNCMKNSIKVLDDFYMKIFHPLADYNLETIYLQLPRLTGVSADEWIEQPVFTEFPVRNIFNEFAIDGNDNERETSLAMTKPSAQYSRPTGKETYQSFGNGLDDIQKKIIPWKSMIPFNEDSSEDVKAKLLLQRTESNNGGIVVVASLIDRPPNLGGLARTCEIFGVTELVIGSLGYVDDRQFKALSVSAEKWITITEVKPHLLQNYLLEQRSKGWKLIGAEQTANSTNLLEMEFDKKTILLLGNEKDGIPANLIPLLDGCIEIPQNGVVRSLNVHVTGAICIWQYAKQHLLT